MSKRQVPSEVLTFLEKNVNNRGQLLAPRLSSETPARSYSVAPGDKACCMLGGKKRGARQGWLSYVIEPGPQRCEILCPHFGYCGGCTYQHINYSAQLSLKSQPIIDLVRSKDPQAEILSPQAAPTPWYYRSKVEFSFIGDHLGFNIRGLFQKVVDVEECFIGPPHNREILNCVRQWQKRHNFSGWNPRENKGFLRYLVIRHSFSEDEFLVTLVTTTPTTFSLFDLSNPMYELAEELSSLGAHGVIQALNDEISPVATSQRDILLAGSETICERVNDLKLSLGWRSFFQSNPPAYANMLRQAKMLVGPQEKILDLYCGVGSIGLSLDGYVIGVENVAQAVENAKINACNLQRQAEFYCANSEDWPDLNCSLLVIDPPRSGCHPRMIERLLTGGPEKILYISCNPLRFVEEYEKLKDIYGIKVAQMYDFFPHTPHIESMFILERRGVH
ncbi:23S rRNA (uracil(1939)-C(5))-methyltransferase RlmD [bacterium]|nr:23S rRNA (uracil(1939)-C(5))-methyltransferase RlmD [bacterium]